MKATGYGVHRTINNILVLQEYEAEIRKETAVIVSRPACLGFKKTVPRALVLLTPVAAWKAYVAECESEAAYAEAVAHNARQVVALAREGLSKVLVERGAP